MEGVVGYMFEAEMKAMAEGRERPNGALKGVGCGVDQVSG